MNGQRVAVRPGSLVFTQPGEKHDFAPCDRGDLAYHEVTFEWIHGKTPLTLSCQELLSYCCGVDLNPVSYPVVLKARQQKHLELIFQLLLQHLNQPMHHGQLGTCRAVLDMFWFLVQEVYCPEDAGFAPGLDVLAAARATIERQFAERLELSQMAQEARLSTAYFCRAFKARYRTSPMAMQKRLRIQAAKNLLLSSSLSVKEIAIQVGYSDIYTFSKTFKRIAGVSPSAFAERHENKTPQ